MKLATFRFEGRERIGLATAEDAIVDLGEAFEATGTAGPPGTLLELVEAGPELRATLEAVHAAAHRIPLRRISVAEVAWLPPIRRPSKVIGVALNNAIFSKLAYRYFEEPSFFLKPPSALVGHGEPIEIAEEYGLTHPEPELACIIGRRARRIAERDALDHVFGYTIINDVTSPGLKDRDSLHLEMPPGIPGVTDEIPWRRQRCAGDRDLFLTYHARSKGCDTFGPIGPWLVTADEIPNPNQLGIRAWLGDSLVTEDSTANLSFPVEHVIAHLSRYMTLEPGDVVHFGTAANPARYTLREADMSRLGGPLSIAIERLGTLSNPVTRI